VSRYAPIRARVEQNQARGLQRQLSRLEMTGPVTGVCDGAPVTVFCSNDYLGLARHPAVMAAFQGSGVGGSRLISGNRPAHDALEAKLSACFGRPATLFSSGYHANLALLSTVVDRGDTVVSDALNHASIIDGTRLSRARRIIAPHGDPSAIVPGTRMAVVEGLYSMDGDTLDLAAYRGDHWLAVDEAHAFGAIGPGGRGVAAAQQVVPDFVVGTLGKAIGTYGAFVVGPPDLRSLLVSQGRSFIFTTGLPEPIAAASMVALDLVTDALRSRLAENVEQLRAGLSELGVVALGEHHIVPIVLGSRTMAVAAALLERGFLAVGIRAPTVPAGQERIRITLSAAHTSEQIAGLLRTISAVMEST
jgi:8-amino-7-oxononanoate synthase